MLEPEFWLCKQEIIGFLLQHNHRDINLELFKNMFWLDFDYSVHNKKYLIIAIFFITFFKINIE